MRHEQNRPLLRIRPLAQLHKRINEVRCVVADTILRCHGPEMNNVSVVAEREDARSRYVVLEEVNGPEYAVFGGPCCFAVSCETVDEDDAVFGTYFSIVASFYFSYSPVSLSVGGLRTKTYSATASSES